MITRSINQIRDLNCGRMSRFGFGMSVTLSVITRIVIIRRRGTEFVEGIAFWTPD